MINRDRLIKLTKIAEEFADNPGFISLRDSFSGAGLAISALAGHFILFHDLSDDELLGCIIVKEFIERLGNNTDKEKV